MGGKSASKAASREADQARSDEQARQAKIRQGTQEINSIFDGRTVGDGLVTNGSAYDPGVTYYKADGSAWTPTPGALAPSATKEPVRMALGVKRGADPIGSGPAEPRAARAAPATLSAEEQFRTALSGGLYSGTKATAGFNDAFFDKQRQSYIDYATPQIDQQYQDANEQLSFALARSGLLDSSVRSDKASDLQKLYDLNRQKVSDDALGYATKARTSVEESRADLIRTLNATGDAQGAVNSALARSTALSQPQAYSPLGQLFGDFTNALGAQAAAERSFAAGGPAPAFQTSLFGTPSSATQVKR